MDAQHPAVRGGRGAAVGRRVRGVGLHAGQVSLRRPGTLIFNILIGGILVPAVVLALPLYLLFAEVGHQHVLVGVAAQMRHPFGVYLSRVYAGAARPRRAASKPGRIDGAGDGRSPHDRGAA